jgi:hypothetical protein
MSYENTYPVLAPIVVPCAAVAGWPKLGCGRINSSDVVV